MQSLNKVSEEIASKIKQKNPSFDILLAFTIGKIILDIIICFMKLQQTKESAYSRYQKMGPIEKVIIRAYVAKYFPRGSNEHEEVSKILIEEKFDKEIFESVYKEVLENK